MELAKYDDLEGMSRIGFIGNYEIYINTDDSGDIPHFHYRLRDDWEVFHTCIEITRPRYFHHYGKENILSSHQQKDLQKFLSAKANVKGFSGTNWDLTVSLWNLNNSIEENTLNASQQDELQKFMRSKPDPRISSDKTNWEFLVRQWNANNSNRMVDIDAEMPDYTKPKMNLSISEVGYA